MDESAHMDASTWLGEHSCLVGGDENLGWAKHLSLPGLYPTDEYSSSRSSADKRMLAPSWEVPSIQQFAGQPNGIALKKKSLSCVRK